jgi:hypothetical protein
MSSEKLDHLIEHGWGITICTHPVEGTPHWFTDLFAPGQDHEKENPTGAGPFPTFEDMAGWIVYHAAKPSWDDGFTIEDYRKEIHDNERQMGEHDDE